MDMFAHANEAGVGHGNEEIIIYRIYHNSFSFFLQ